MAIITPGTQTNWLRGVYESTPRGTQKHHMQHRNPLHRGVIGGPQEPIEPWQVTDPEDRIYGASSSNLSREQTNGAGGLPAGTETWEDLLKAVGGKNFKTAIGLAKHLSPKPRPVDWPLMSFMYFADMAARASEPGATAFGAAAKALQKPSEYLLKQKELERKREDKLPLTALSIAKMLKDDGDDKHPKQYEVTQTIAGKTTTKNRFLQPDEVKNLIQKGATLAEVLKPTPKADYKSIRGFYIADKRFKQFAELSEKFGIVEDAYRQAYQIDRPMVADLAMVFAFMKMLDPNSVVREGEQQQAKATGGAADYLVAVVKSLKGEGSLTDLQRKSFRDSAYGFYMKNVAAFKDLNEQISEEAKSVYGLTDLPFLQKPKEYKDAEGNSTLKVYARFPWEGADTVKNAMVAEKRLKALSNEDIIFMHSVDKENWKPEEKIYLSKELHRRGKEGKPLTMGMLTPELQKTLRNQQGAADAYSRRIAESLKAQQAQQAQTGDKREIEELKRKLEEITEELRKQRFHRQGSFRNPGANFNRSGGAK